MNGKGSKMTEYEKHNKKTERNDRITKILSYILFIIIVSLLAFLLTGCQAKKQQVATIECQDNYVYKVYKFSSKKIVRDNSGELQKCNNGRIF